MYKETEHLEDIWAVYSTDPDLEENKPYKNCYLSSGDPFSKEHRAVFTGTYSECREFGENTKNCLTLHEVGS